MKTTSLIIPAALASTVAALVIPQLNNDALIAYQQGPQAVLAEPKLLKDMIPKKAADAIHKSFDKTKEAIGSLEDKAAPFVTSVHALKNLIPHSYIIILKDDINQQDLSSHVEWAQTLNDEQVGSLLSSDPNNTFFDITGIKADSEAKDKKLGGINHVFSLQGFTGYSATLLPDTIEQIRRHPSVLMVEQDSVVYASEFDTEKGAPWGLARISHREKLSLGTFSNYLFDNEGGEGVTSYVIDTGINVDHVDFDGRAKWGKTIPQNDQDIDGNGHGTHCAGTIASKTYGVAKGANVVAVKVLGTNGSGSMADVVKGVEWAANSHIAASKSKKKGFKGSTANMSLGGGKSPSLDNIVNAAVSAGLHFAVAAGNENQDACNSSPAAAENAVTVGASTLGDDRAYFSNFGKCVDIFAPGLNVLSTYIGSQYATASLSGTSMASPHIAGLLSYFLSLQPETDSGFATSTITPAQLKKNLIAYGTPNILKDVNSDTPNILAFNGAGQNLTSFWSGHKSDVEEVKNINISEDKRISLERKLNEKILPLTNKIIEEVNELVDEMREEFNGVL